MTVKSSRGSLVTRERESLAASRLACDVQVPLTVVTNGQDAEILDTLKGKVLDRIDLAQAENQIYHKEQGLPPSLIQDRCTGCRICERVCPYQAIEMVQANRHQEPYHRIKYIPKIDEKLCYGCGLCVTSCPVYALNSPYESVK